MVNKVNLNYRGITLIALVITVIVLLILAGVAISAITGEDGILSKARISAEKYNNGAKNEAEKLSTIISDSEEALEPEPNGNFSEIKGVNAPDTSKLPIATTKYVTWTGTDTFTEVLTDKKTANWYDYSNSKWANIKTTSTDGSLEAYWVWIPRFAYKLPESSTPKTIEVAFVKGNGTTVINPTTGLEEQAYYATDTAITTDESGLYVRKTSDAASKWIIHPAFSFGNDSKLNYNTQLAGIWIAKYEANSTNPDVDWGGDDTTSLKVQVKPSMRNWRHMTISNAFIVCRAIQNNGGALGTTTGNTELDTHLIKNMEWGATAILSQSKYGNYDRETNANIQVWNNPNGSDKTGYAGDTKDQTTAFMCYAYNTKNGVKASTTGNVYGIYDMAGGTTEYVAGAYSNTNKWNSVEAKYYDFYNKIRAGMSDYEEGKIGDMGRELSGSNQTSWNEDSAKYADGFTPTFIRGGNRDSGVNAGLFSLDFNYGDVTGANSFRPSMIAF